MNITLHFKSYIAAPYWAECEKVVNIQKQSGMNRARSEDRREKALSLYLEKIGMTVEQYRQLEIDAKRPWYQKPDGKIYIPRHHLSGCLVQACKSAPAGARFSQDQLRCLLQISDFVTEKTKADELFERFILPTDGKGNKLSNQRRFTSNEVITDFDAEGSIDFDADDVKPKSVMDLLNYAGKYIGCGASRKMGYGRFTAQLVVDK